MSTPKNPGKQTDATAEDEEASHVQSEELARSTTEEEPTEGDLVGGGAAGAAVGGLVGGAGGALIGGVLGLTRGALREGGKKKRSGW
jgi:hypothetical protein